MLTDIITSPMDLEDTTKICLDILSRFEWLKLRSEYEPYTELGYGDTYSIDFVTPLPHETPWAGDLRLVQFDENTLIECYVNNGRFRLFVAALNEEYNDDTDN